MHFDIVEDCTYEFVQFLQDERSPELEVLLVSDTKDHVSPDAERAAHVTTDTASVQCIETLRVDYSTKNSIRT